MVISYVVSCLLGGGCGSTFPEVAFGSIKATDFSNNAKANVFCEYGAKVIITQCLNVYISQSTGRILFKMTPLESPHHSFGLVVFILKSDQ